MGCFGVISRLIFLIFVSGCLGIAAAVGASAFLRSAEAAPLIGVVVAALVFLYNLRSVFRTRKRKQVIATIVQVWVQSPPGAPWYYWTYVLFESRGERIKVHLTKQQAKAFRAQMGEGDTGYLEFSGDRLISWHVASASSPLPARNQVSVFLSYSHGWSNEAAYISQVFQTYGISVWRDVEQLHAGDQLNKKYYF